MHHVSSPPRCESLRTATGPSATRWQRLQQWATDDPVMQRRFRQQLRERTGWSNPDIDAAITEYLRFCDIAAAREGRVAPSPAIDEVWHLHLTWTRDYWLDFCPHRLGFGLHHQPSTGRTGEAARLRDDYAETLQAYAERFGVPPERWWPRFSASARATPSSRGWRRLAGTAAAMLLPTHAHASLIAGTPLDWRGADFLVLYLMLAAAALVGGLLWRALQWHRSSRTASTGPADTWELAYLAGGPERVVDSAVAELDRRKAIVWNPRLQQFNRGSASALGDDLLDAVRAQLTEAKPNVHRAARSTALTRIHAQLQRRGWWFGAQEARRIAQLSALPMALVTAFGVAKIGVGLMRDRPVALLVVACIATLITTLVFYFKRPGITAAGKVTLRQAQSRNALTVRAHRGEQVALAVALGGTAVLAGTALAGYHAFRHPPGSTGDSGSTTSGGSSDSSDSDGGGGGCGGCGGGGD